jgi:hypothetical protein
MSTNVLAYVILFMGALAEGSPVAFEAAVVSWENLRNLLKRNGPIWHQLGK